MIICSDAVYKNVQRYSLCTRRSINQHLIRPIFKRVHIQIYHAEILLRMSKKNFFKNYIPCVNRKLKLLPYYTLYIICHNREFVNIQFDRMRICSRQNGYMTGRSLCFNYNCAAPGVLTVLGRRGDTCCSSGYGSDVSVCVNGSN